MADSNMIQVNNPGIGQVLSIDYLVEKAAEGLVNKALMKLDNFVDVATRKIDEAVEKAYDQAFIKFSEQIREKPSSTQTVNETVKKAVQNIDQAHYQAFAKFSDYVREKQSSIRKLDEIISNGIERINEAADKACDQAFTKFLNQLEEKQLSDQRLDEAFARYLERLSDLQQPSMPTGQSRQGAADVQMTETAVDTVISGHAQSSQEPMETEETGILYTSEDDEFHDMMKDLSKTIWEHPHPGSTYAIHMDGYRKPMLAVDKDYDLIAHPYVENEVGTDGNKHCHWRCTGEANGTFSFRNVASRMYLGVVFRDERPNVTTMSRNNTGHTKFCLRSAIRESYLLQAQQDDCVAYVTAEYDTPAFRPSFNEGKSQTDECWTPELRQEETRQEEVPITKMEILLDQALEKIIGNAVDRAVEKSIAGYSTHYPGSVSSDLTEEQDAAQNESGEDESEQESMDVDEMAGSMAEADYDDNESSEDDDDEMADLFTQYRSTLSNPWPGFISRIDVFGNKEFDLAVNKDMQLVLVSTREGTILPDHLENSRQWEMHPRKEMASFTQRSDSEVSRS
ncbi:hypothetical protein TCE0_022f06638 [Talaromyces pinophilus]|uniref:Uncharacterized protein n=1 Tax=Talaromyces pinophilus TaxID=128442 RepID=A0A6V8H8A2_TALPI|nr:hypothetical protein TCE0_022f06638 [Talaromyces pinophilus]